MTSSKDDSLEILHLPPQLTERITQTHRSTLPPNSLLPHTNDDQKMSLQTAYILYAPTVVIRSEHNPALALACRLANYYHVPLIILAVFLDDVHMPTVDNDGAEIGTLNVAFTARRLTFWLQAVQHAAMSWSQHYGAGVAIRVHGGHRGNRTPHHLTLARRALCVVTDEPFCHPHLEFVESLERVAMQSRRTKMISDGSSVDGHHDLTSIPCYRVDGSTLVPPASRLRRKYDENGTLIRKCMAGAGAGTGLLPSKAWRWNKATEANRRAHIRAAISEGQFSAPQLEVRLARDFFVQSPSRVNDERNDKDDDDEHIQSRHVSLSSSKLEMLSKMMPSDWCKGETPAPGRRPWTVDELQAIPNLSIWACQWTQVNDADINITIDGTCTMGSNHVPPCQQTHGSLPAAQKRWSNFLLCHLEKYAKLRNQINRPLSVSRMSCYLNWGIVSIFRMCHDLNTARISKPKFRGTIDKYEEEIIKWREFSYAHAFGNPDSYNRTLSVPQWARRYLNGQKRDQKKNVSNGRGQVEFQQLEGGRSPNDTWNAMQQYLERTGELHNNARMTWGKTIVHWLKRQYDVADILKIMCYLNDRYALDGLAPPSYAGILWCLGWGDKPTNVGKRGDHGDHGDGWSISEKNASRYRVGPDGFKCARLIIVSTVDTGNNDAYTNNAGYELKQCSIIDSIVPTLEPQGQKNSEKKRSRSYIKNSSDTNDGKNSSKMRIISVGGNRKKTLMSYFSPTNKDMGSS